MSLEGTALTGTEILQCVICENFADREEVMSCLGCGEAICYSCPAFACACKEAGDKGEVKATLRAAALELGRLYSGATLLGVEALEPAAQAQLELLSDVVASLRDEYNKLDERNDGFAYGANG